MRSRNRKRRLARRRVRAAQNQPQPVAIMMILLVGVLLLLQLIGYWAASQTIANTGHHGPDALRPRFEEPSSNSYSISTDDRW